MALHLHENGCYGVMIHNNRGMTDEELMKEFEKYGKVKEVQKGGRNLVFAHFKEYEEAKDCLISLCDDPDYCAKPARPRESRASGRGPGSEQRARSLHRSDHPARSSTTAAAHHAQNRCKSMTRLEAFQKELRKKQEMAERENKKSSSSEDEEESEKQGKPLGVRFNLREESGQKGEGKVPPPLSSSPVGPFITKFQTRKLGYVAESCNLVHMQDYLEAQKMAEQNGTRNMTDVLLANLPLWFMMGDVFELCAKFCKVLHVDMVYSRDPRVVPYALLFVPSFKHARHLSSHLHGTVLDNKRLVCQAIQDLMAENPQYP